MYIEILKRELQNYSMVHGISLLCMFVVVVVVVVAAAAAAADVVVVIASSFAI